MSQESSVLRGFPEKADDLHYLQSRQVSRTTLDKTSLKGFRLHKTENFCLTLPEGINPIQTKSINSTRKCSYEWDKKLRPGWIHGENGSAPPTLMAAFTRAARAKPKTQNKSTPHLQGTAFLLLSSPYLVSPVQQKARRTQAHSD